jgi:predicted phosphodiesterase
MEVAVQLKAQWIAIAGWVVVAAGLTGCASPPLVEATPGVQVQGTQVAPAVSPEPLASASATQAPSPSPIAMIPVDLPLADIAYALPLTIRHLTPDSVTLFFELSQPSSGRVLIQAEDGSAPPIELELDPVEGRWLRTIDGLSPGKRYRVVVALQPEGQPPAQPQFRSAAWGPVSFQTASPGEPLRIGVISDASFGDPATFDLVRQMAAADLDLVLHAGDVVDETADGQNPFESYAEKFYAPFEPLLTRMPVYTVPGNHDYDADIRLGQTPFYYHAFPPFPDPGFPGQEAAERNQYYAFRRDDLQFILLDTQVLFGVSGREDQARWLSERLNDPRSGPTIAVMHVAPYSSSSVHPTDSLPPRQQWVPLLEAADVPLVLSGHFHGYERLAANGITYLVAGGGSSTLYAFADRLPESQASARRTHFVLLEVDGGPIRLTAIALGGEVLDQATVTLAPDPG